MNADEYNRVNVYCIGDEKYFGMFIVPNSDPGWVVFSENENLSSVICIPKNRIVKLEYYKNE